MDGILFCGDAAMKYFPSIKRTIIWIEDLKSFKVSWEKIIALNPDAIYPGHGKPFKTEDLKKCLSHLDKVKLRPLRKEQN
jgi:glyoxylase-like metal-dependent hydrolase (beta-lactamase superfamily II)